MQARPERYTPSSTTSPSMSLLDFFLSLFEMGSYSVVLDGQISAFRTMPSSASQVQHDQSFDS